ncbi:MAG: dethiobiotin synthase [Phycisphaeraceae bacterium]|nr:MAG: dethiobiotin synthase [Phycisphaeraceae bacterium]
MSLFAELHRPGSPGLFITGTDTGVGKTVAACLIADQFRRQTLEVAPRSRIGVFKPIATGCRREREGLVSDDAEQLAHAADFDPDVGNLALINPIRFRPPLAPAAALEKLGRSARLEVDEIDASLRRLDERCAAIVVEGIGGVMVPLARSESRGGGRKGRGQCETVLDLMAAIGYPVVVVCRAGLGTLNHTAMTVRLIREAGLTLAGLVMNGYDPESTDESMQSNRAWLARQNQTSVLATLPGWTGTGRSRKAIHWDVRAIDPALREAIDSCDFAALCRRGRGVGAS